MTDFRFQEVTEIVGHSPAFLTDRKVSGEGGFQRYSTIQQPVAVKYTAAFRLPLRVNWKTGRERKSKIKCIQVIECSGDCVLWMIQPVIRSFQWTKWEQASVISGQLHMLPHRTETCWSTLCRFFFLCLLMSRWLHVSWRVSRENTKEVSILSC